jgi:hypothetical protein
MQTLPTFKCMDVPSWRVFTKEEMRTYLKDTLKPSGSKDRASHYKSILAVRRAFSPVDMYCYLKARFGKPNGFQTFLAKDTSDNWIHWDFNLKVQGEDVCISGTYREIHFMLSEKLSDCDWPMLFEKIKADFGRLGKEKAAILRSLEKWLIFPNKYIAVSNVCSDLHSNVLKDMKILSPDALDLPSSYEKDSQAHRYRRLIRQMSDLYRNSLELSLITPVLAEAFINMAILILCRKEVRNNTRQFDAFLRSQIDAKIFDLPYKCRGFVKRIDPDAPAYKKFKRVMDKRNHAIHGNIDPEREQIEVVYFEGKRPLFKEPGDHIAKRLEAPLRQHSPEQIVKDYEDTHLFLNSLGDCLEPNIREQFWQLMEDPYPGYDSARQIVGALLPIATTIGHLQGVRYDDELKSED